MTPDERAAERRTRCTTDAQRKTFDRLTKLGKDVYAERRQGKGILAECRRYLDTCDASKIGEGLYHLSMHGAGGFNDIAHYNLAGYRGTYPHPYLWIDQVVAREVDRWPMEYRLSPDGYHSFYVYTDGMHSGEVAHAVVALCNENGARVVADYERRNYERDRADFEALAAKLGIATYQEPLRVAS